MNVYMWWNTFKNQRGKKKVFIPVEKIVLTASTTSSPCLCSSVNLYPATSCHKMFIIGTLKSCLNMTSSAYKFQWFTFIFHYLVFRWVQMKTFYDIHDESKYSWWERKHLMSSSISRLTALSRLCFPNPKSLRVFKANLLCAVQCWPSVFIMPWGIFP